MPLTQKIALLTLAVAMTVGLSLAWWISNGVENTLTRKLQDAGTLLAKSMAESQVARMLARDVVETTHAFKRVVKSNDDVAYIFLTDFDGEMFAHSFEGGMPEQLKHDPADSLVVRVVAFQGRRIMELHHPLIEGMPATLHIGMSVEGTAREIQHVRKQIIMGSIAIGMVVALLSLVLSRRISQPLRILSSRIAEYGRTGKLDLDPESYKAGGVEVAFLAESMMQMMAERNRSEQTSNLYGRALEHSGEAFMITDHDNRIVAINSAFTHLTGYELEEVRGRNPSLLASGKTTQETYQSMWAALRESGFWQGELWDRAKDGRIYPKWITISLIRDPSGQLTHHVASFTDISERKAAEDHINHLAHHDALTGLFNRFSLQERLEQALFTAQRENRQLVVMFIDMDRFKLINDTLGHHTGDKLLIEVARRLKASVRESDIVARLGGDEFVIVLTGVESGMHSGSSIASKILHLLGEPYRIGEKDLHSSPSIGLSVYPGDGDNVDILMKNADNAMYHAKEQGRNNYQFFTTTMNDTVVERLRMEHELHIAIAEEQFELYYQPQVRTVDRRIYGVEALLRWHHPKQGMIPPIKFIPLAEETGLIEAIGAWVLNEACRQLAAWKTQGIGITSVAVNLSAHQLGSPNLSNLVGETMARHGIDSGELELEVTESVAMHDPEQAIDQLNSLRELGVELAIDDFGTGYSSLAYLKLLPIQTLKLDRTFLNDIETDENNAAISAATVSLAHTLGLKVVAEGVETRAQETFLFDHACDIQQGYLHSRPLPAIEMTRFWIGHMGQ